MQVCPSGSRPGTRPAAGSCSPGWRRSAPAGTRASGSPSSHGAAETTTGPLYHHFGSKLGLYDVIRSDVERRVTDRMEGALATAPARRR